MCKLKNEIINSGPGTGKTHYMMNRIKELCDTGELSYNDILGITFMNNSARNMKERLKEYPKINISTIHSYCIENLKGSLNIIDPDILDGIVEQYVVDTGNRYSKDNISKSLLYTTLDKWRTYCFMLSENLGLQHYNKNVTREDLIDGYISIKHSNNPKEAIKIRKVLTSVIKILKTLNSVGYVDFFSVIIHGFFELSADFKYIIVDEFQDLTYIEYRCITNLSKQAKYLLLCDTNQGIYFWRNSSFSSNISHFKKNIGELHIILMDKNYRCSKSVVNLCNAMSDKSDAALDTADAGQCKVIKGVDLDRFALDVYNNTNKDETIAFLTQTNAKATSIANTFRLNNIGVYHKIKNYYSDSTFIRLYLKMLNLSLKPFNTKALCSIVSDNFFTNKYDMNLTQVLSFFKEQVSSELLYNKHISVQANGSDSNINYVVFDTESTGVNYNEDDIVQIAGIKLDKDFNEIDRIELYLKTDKDLSSSEEVHKISKEFLEQHGIEPSSALEQFCKFTEGCILVAHNCYFDKSIITNQLIRYNLLSSFKPSNYICTLDFSYCLIKDDNLPNYKLESLIKHLGLSGNPNHNAIYDVEATIELFKYLVNYSRQSDLYNKYSNHYVTKYIDVVLQEIYSLNPFNLSDLYTNLLQKVYSPKTSEINYVSNFVDVLNNLLQQGKPMTYILDFFLLKDDIINNNNNVTICTIHQSKGLEFDHVYMIQEYKSFGNTESNNVEYVAVSRAKKTFTIINQSGKDSRISNMISRIE